MQLNEAARLKSGKPKPNLAAAGIVHEGVGLLAMLGGNAASPPGQAFRLSDHCLLQKAAGLCVLGNNMPRMLLFAYGTLLDERIRRRVFGRDVGTSQARLAGWQVWPRRVQGRYPGILPSGRAQAAGAVLALRPGELAKADAYEDVPRLYRRVRVTVRSARKATRCWVYVPAAGLAAGLACGREPVLASRC